MKASEYNELQYSHRWPDQSLSKIPITGRRGDLSAVNRYTGHRWIQIHNVHDKSTVRQLCGDWIRMENEWRWQPSRESPFCARGGSKKKKCDLEMICNSHTRQTEREMWNVWIDEWEDGWIPALIRDVVQVVNFKFYKSEDAFAMTLLNHHTEPRLPWWCLWSVVSVTAGFEI